jgi:hypothetical protein
MAQIHSATNNMSFYTTLPRLVPLIYVLIIVRFIRYQQNDCHTVPFIWKVSFLTNTCQIFAWPMWSCSHDSCTWLLDVPNGTNWTNISYMSDCQAYTRRGNGKTSLFLITKPTCRFLAVVSHLLTLGWKRWPALAQADCSQDDPNIRNLQMFVKYIGSEKTTQTSCIKV